MAETDGGRVYHLDEEKPRVDLLPMRALLEVAKVQGFGAKKYGDRNWEYAAMEGGWRYGQLIASAMRHVMAFMLREDADPESGLPHLAHAAWNLMALLELVIFGRGEDDRTPLRTEDS